MFDTNDATFNNADVNGDKNYVAVTVAWLCRGWNAGTPFHYRVAGQQIDIGCSTFDYAPNVSSFNLFAVPKSAAQPRAGYPQNKVFVELDAWVDGGAPAQGFRVAAYGGNGLVTFHADTPQGSLPNVDGQDPPQTAACPNIGYHCNQYGSLGTAFALWYNPNATGGKTDLYDYEMEFKADCGFTGTQATLRWYDADAAIDGTQWYGHLWYELVDETAGGVVVHSDGNSGSLGGNDSYRDYTFNIAKDHIYSWRWHGVSATNGIQFWMPFSELNTVVTCSSPPKGNVDSANCNAINGWAFDPDNTLAYLNIHVYFDYPAGDPRARAIALSPAVPPYPRQAGFPRQPNQNEYNVTHRPDILNVFPGVGDYHGFSIPHQAYAQFDDAYAHTVYVYAIDAAGGDTNPLIGQGTVSYCAEPSCTASDLSTVPSSPQPGENFNEIIAIQYRPGSQGWDINWDITTTLPGATPSSQRKVGWSNKTGKYPPWVPAPPSPTNSPSFGGFTYPTAGPRSTSWTLYNTANNKTISCGSTYTVANKPYVRIYGNDLMVGGNFAVSGTNPACNPTAINSTATIYAFADVQNSWDSPGAVGPEHWVGSGTQYAVFALGVIQRMFSASQHSPRVNNSGTGNTSPVTDLTFRNFDPNNKIGSISGTTAGRATGILDPEKIPGYGGESNMPHCSVDWFNNPNRPASAQPGNNLPVDTSNINGRGNVDGVYYYSPPSGVLRIMKTADLLGGKAIFVNGDVVIDSDITYSNFSNVQKSAVPSLYVIAKGNIYIRNTVQRLDGVFIAQPNPLRTTVPTGKIFTCANVTGINVTTYNADQLAANCGTKLTVNGSFIARQIKFLRTGGTLKNASPNEAASSGNIAEVFNFSPETYLAENPIFKQNNGSKYDMVNTLPPVL